MAREAVRPPVTQARPEQSRGAPWLICLAAWVIPGAGHLWLGRRRTGTILLIAVPLMFAIGIAIKGQLFPFDPTNPLVGLAALADLGNGLAYFVAAALGLGRGEVTAVTYEYGNVYIIVAGLLNSLVVLDAYDIAVGRK